MHALAAHWLWVWPHFAAFVRLLHCTLPTPLPLALLSTETHFFWPPRWLVGSLAGWLLVKWLGPMQRWLIPRSSRVKVGRHSVDGKESKPQPKQKQKQKLKQKQKHKLKAKPYRESNSYRRYDSFILFVSRKRTNKPNWSVLTYLVSKPSSKEFQRAE